jgi:hypothetical protein
VQEESALQLLGNKIRNVFVFGAGASYASADISPGQPPLGNQLFDAVLPLSPTAQSLSEAQKRAFRVNFEEGMRLIMEGRDLLLVSNLYVDIAKLLIELHAGSNSSYVDIMKIVWQDHNIFSTLNYDLLLEDSLQHFLDWAKYHLPPSECVFQIQKLHGSVNFLPDGPKIIGGNAQHVGKIGAVPFKSFTRQQARVLLEYPGQLMPDMNLYILGKDNLYTNSPSAHFYHKWKDDLDKADHIFVCGVAVNLADEHIWNPISKNISKLKYFGTPNDKSSFEALSIYDGFYQAYFDAKGINGLVDHLKLISVPVY